MVSGSDPVLITAGGMGLIPGQGMNILHATWWQNTYIGCSVAKSCLTLCDPMNCSTPDFPVLHYLVEFAQACVHWVGDTIQPSHPVTLFSSSPQSFPGSESFPGSRFFTWGGQSIGASASVLPVNMQGWFPLGLTGLISLLSYCC